MSYIDRIARAIYGAAEYDALPERATYLERKTHPERHWDDREQVRQSVRDGLAAMRDPTEAVLHAGAFTERESDEGGWMVGWADARQVHERMIDAALAEGESRRGRSAGVCRTST